MSTEKIEYHEGYFAAGNNIPFDESKSEAWKEGYKDGIGTLYGDVEARKDKVSHAVMRLCRG